MAINLANVVRSHWKNSAALVILCCLISIYYYGADRLSSSDGPLLTATIVTRHVGPAVPAGNVSHQQVAMLRKQAGLCLNGRPRTPGSHGNVYISSSATVDKQALRSLKVWLKSRYLYAARQSLAGKAPCNASIVAYRACVRGDSDKLHCQSWGDRLRGILATFYLAMLSGRVFYIEPSNRIDKMFQVNHQLYRVPSKTLKTSHNGSFYNLASSPKAFRLFVGDANFSANHQAQRYLVVSANPTYRQLFDNGSLFSNPDFSENLVRYLGECEQSTPRLTRALVVSAAFGLLFERPKPRLLHALERFVADAGLTEVWATSFRIGIKIKIDRHKKIFKGRLVKCLLDEVFGTLQNVTSPGNRSVLVYVSTNSKAVTAQLDKNLTAFSIRIVTNDMLSETVQPTKNGSKSYLDWFVLSQMSLLIANENSIALSAAMTTAIPARMLDHNKPCLFRDFLLVK